MAAYHLTDRSILERNAHFEEGYASGSGGGKIRQMDKIIQITDTLNNNGDGQTLGLSESGKVYRYLYDLESHPEPHPVFGVKNWSKTINHRWELLLESPIEEL